MAVLIPTKKIPQLTAYGFPLAGSEMLEISVIGTSRRITSRDFVLPIDSLVTVADQSAVLPGSRHIVSSATVQVNDGGAGGTLSFDMLGTGALPGNPTALVGLVAVNGAAGTWMRSDAAPALDQAIAPTWAGQHIFAVPPISQGTGPRWDLDETDAAADNRRWQIAVQSEQLRMRVANDALGVVTDFMTVDRTGTVIDIVNLQATTVQVNGVNVRDATNLFNTGTVPAARLPSSFSGLANPTASLGLTAINGVATTAMRSDAAPALNQAIAPSWSGRHVFAAEAIDAQAGLAIAANRPELDISENDAAVDNRRWNFTAVSEQLRFRLTSDDGLTNTNWLTVDRTGTTADTITLAANTADLTVGSSRVSSTVQIRSTRDFATGNLINYGLLVDSNNPAIGFREADAAANNGIWDIAVIGEQMQFRTLGDGVLSPVNWMTVDRTGTTINIVAISTPLLQTPGIHNGTAPTGTTNAIASGTYTPTITLVTNVTSTGAAEVCQWMRVGNVVTVSGRVSAIQPTATGFVTIAISLPIASNLSSAQQAAGVAAPDTSSASAATLRGDTANDRISWTYNATATSTGNFTFTFTYLVL